MMQHMGFEYSVLQTANPTGWKWVILLDEKRTKVGHAFSRASAVSFAEFAIKKLARKNRVPNAAARPMPAEVDG